MADVFISYQRSDRDTAARLAKALERAGYDVWWDNDLLAGEDFRLEIRRTLDRVRACVVLWSVRSVGSRFVLDEAGYADGAGKLCPAFIESCRPPMGFGGLHGADLTTWRGEADHPGLRQLIDAVRQKMRRTSGPGRIRPQSASRRTRGSDASLGCFLAVVALLGFLGVALISIQLGYYYWTVPQQEIAIEEALSSVRQEALQRRQQDATAWRTARAADAVAGYDNYLMSFPGGIYATEARAAIWRLQGDALDQLPSELVEPIQRARLAESLAWERAPLGRQAGRQGYEARIAAQQGRPGFAVKINHETGEHWAGQVLKGVPHGDGEYRSSTGQVSSGPFVYGTLDGVGRSVWETPAGETIYIGDHRGGVFEGYGLQIMPNGEQYAGEFRNGSRHGYGVVRSPDGRRVEGARVPGQPDGPLASWSSDGTLVRAGNGEPGAWPGSD